MTEAFTLVETRDVDGAKESLAQLIERAFDHLATARGGRRALRLEVPVEPVEPLHWLLAQGNRSRGYWRDRRGGYELAGIGTADVLTGEVQADLDALMDRLHASIAAVHPNLRYFGGMRFNPATPLEEKWTPFGAYRFVLPRFEVLKRGQQAYLACNIVQGVPPEDGLKQRLLDTLEAMPFPEGAPAAALPPVHGRTDTPDRASYESLVNDALAAIRAGTLTKVVLARVAEIAFEAMPDPIAVLVRLSSLAPNAFQFCFQPREDAAFFGASPERLYKRQDRYVQSESLAGTRGRGATPEEDAALADALMASEKDRREQRIVTEVIKGVLEQHCHAAHAEAEPAILRLHRCQHLQTRLEGIMRGEGSDAALLRDLQPTPAVGGHPREAALAHIARAEPFDRGWYAGPVGWVSGDAAEFAVGIRSGLVRGERLHLFAGAGIVEGSDPADEWRETENKLLNILGVLGPDDRA